MCWYGHWETKPVGKPSIAEVHIFDNERHVFADIDECKSIDVCVGHICVNLLGSYRCECQAGYIFNSISRVCEGKQSLPSLHRSKPHWIPMSAVCTAVWKFVLTLYHLLDTNECRHYPGRLCAHKCENTPGSYKCSCTTGFKLASDGRNCDGNILLDISQGFIFENAETPSWTHIRWAFNLSSM